MLFAIHMIDRPGAAELRTSLRDEHLAYVGAHASDIYLGGPMLADDGETAVGSLVIMDFPDRAAALALIAEEPYNQAGLFESVTIRAFHPVVAPGGE